MKNKENIALRFQARKWEIFHRQELMIDILQSQYEGTGGYTDDGEDLTYNLLYSIYQDFRKLRADAEKAKSEFPEGTYLSIVERLDEHIDMTSKTLGSWLEEEIVRSGLELNK